MKATPQVQFSARGSDGDSQRYKHISTVLTRFDTPAATINRSLAALKKGLSLAFDAGMTSVNHGLAVKSLPSHNKREIFLTVEQVGRLASSGSEAVEAAV